MAMESNLLALAWAQLWQVTLLVAAVAIFVRLVASNRPHLAYALWLVVLVKCVTPPVWSSPSGVFCWLLPAKHAAIAEPTVMPEPVRLATPREDLIIPLYPVESVPTPTAAPAPIVEAPRPRFTWPDWAAGGLLVWAVGASISLGLSVWRWRACVRKARRVPCEPDLELAERVSGLARRFGLRRRVRVLVTQGRLGPAVTGVLRPTLLMPEGMLVDKTASEIEPLLAHELIHIRRGDLWAGLLQTVVLALWWFHPLVRWAVRQSMREAERCCDEAVLAELACKPRDYARSLLGVLQYKMEWAPAAVFPGAGRIDATSKRLERIMRLGQGCRRRSPWWCWAVMVATAAVVLPGGAFVVSGEKAKGDRAGAPGWTELESVEESPTTAVLPSASAAATETEATIRLAMVYDVENTLSEIAKTTHGTDAAKASLLELCGFDADGKCKHDGESHVAWQDDRLVVFATRSEHETIVAELEAIREYGLCSLEIEVLLLQGPATHIQTLLETKDEGAASLLQEQEEREAEVGLVISCESLVVHADLEQLIHRSKAIPALKVLASPRLRVTNGQSGSIFVGKEVPTSPGRASEAAAVRFVPVGLEMQFQPRLRTQNRVLLHSDVTISEELPQRVQHSEGEESWRASGIRVVSQKASSTVLGPLGETIAIRTQAPGKKGKGSEETLVLVKVAKPDADSPPASRGSESIGEKSDPSEDVREQRDVYVVTYNVADLVLPRPDPVGLSESPATIDEPAPERGKAAPAPRPKGYTQPVPDLSRTAPHFGPLIELITAAIAPASWEQAGGQGRIAPFEANLILVIRQTKDVHEEIADLLAQFRRTQRLQVVLRTQTVEAADEFCRKHWKGAPSQGESAVLDSAAFAELLADLRSNDSTRLTEGPTARLFNGQQIEIPIAILVGTAGVPRRLVLHPCVPGENQNVYLQADIAPSTLHNERKELKRGEALALEISEPAEASATSRRTFVLVTSEIVVIQQEAKQPIAVVGWKSDRN